jgi:GSCFA family
MSQSPDRFRTELNVAPAYWSIDHSMNVMTVGSCFADNVGELLFGHKFPSAVNPLGISYNPLSIHKGIASAILKADVTEGLVESQGTWRHYDFHSKWSDENRIAFVQKLESRLASVRDLVLKTNVLIITYGTSWVYSRKDNNKIVSNCHKRPGNEFEKRLLSIDEIVASFDDFMNTLRTVRPGIKLILTLSPVRHLKDTIELNQVSKSILRAAIHQITKNHSTADYFPAYEIMIDDLRDYRFYEGDMIHPTRTAIEYIWEKFGSRYFSKETLQLCDRWKKASNALNHRPFHPGTTQHREFLLKLRSELEELSKQIDVSKEIAALNAGAA